MAPYQYLEDDQGWYMMAQEARIPRDLWDDDHFRNLPKPSLRRRVLTRCLYYLGLPVQWLHDLTNKLGARCDEMEI